MPVGWPEMTGAVESPKTVIVPVPVFVAASVQVIVIVCRPAATVTVEPTAGVQVGV